MIRVLLADADSATRKGLTLLLNRRLGITTICEATNGSELVSQLTGCQPDLLILDWSLPGRPTLEMCYELQEALRPMQCVILSVNAKDIAFAQTLEALFIHKSTPAEEVLGQLRSLLNLNA